MSTPFKNQKPYKSPGESDDMDPKPEYGMDTYVGKNALAGRVALIPSSPKADDTKPSH